MYIHSVTDIVTNSSSTVYTDATATTKAIIIDLINSLLELGGSDGKAEDYFIIRYCNNYYDWNVEEETTADEYDPRWNEDDYTGKPKYHPFITIEPRVENPLLDHIATIIKNLPGNLFNIYEKYDG